MFTGIVEAVGTVTRVVRSGGVQHTEVACPEVMDDVALGDSIAVEGVCQTVTVRTADTFTFDSVAETLRLTTIGSWRTGRRVNVERSLKVGARLGGHWVLGHVDGVVRLLERKNLGDTIEIRCSLPSQLLPQVALKGSVALDGVSLTVTSVNDSSFGVAVIPFTLEHTTLGGRKTGDEMHLETDVLAKYVSRLLESATPGGKASDSNIGALLREAGFMDA